MNWADIAILVVIMVSLVISVMRGFVREVLSLVAWIAAFWVAAALATPASVLLEPHIEIETLRVVVAFIVVMIVTLIVAGLVNLAIGKLLASAGLSGTDRLLGAVFGIARGAAIVGIAVLLAGLTPLPGQPWWAESRILVPFENAALYVLRWLPPDLAKNFSF